ncbi:MAG: winged helix-turn-helix transcriptional regulator [Nocardiopsaceae bacterium]|nr:winged helix-turn-helix transcriptional regulator [Nocardiopsaceae bacterium]
MPEDPRIYVRVVHRVRAQIEDGTLRPGQPTPTIETFCQQFGCTRQTVSKALRLLADEGLLIRYPGLGYYVSAGEGFGGERPRGYAGDW